MLAVAQEEGGMFGLAWDPGSERRAVSEDTCHLLVATFHIFTSWAIVFLLYSRAIVFLQGGVSVPVSILLRKHREER